MSENPVLAQIDDLVKTNDVVLFMKGVKTMPACGFSAKVAQILQYLNVEFNDVNVMSSADLRQGIKDYANWPTIPQLYVKGDFVGGADIVTEMTLSGELDQLFAEKGISFDKARAEEIRAHNQPAA